MKRNTRKAAPTAPEHFTPANPAETAVAVQPHHPVLVAVSEHLRRHDIVYAVLADAAGLLVGMSNETFAWSEPGTREGVSGAGRLSGWGVWALVWCPHDSHPPDGAGENGCLKTA